MAAGGANGRTTSAAGAGGRRNSQRAGRPWAWASLKGTGKDRETGKARPAIKCKRRRRSRGESKKREVGSGSRKLQKMAKGAFGRGRAGRMRRRRGLSNGRRQVSLKLRGGGATFRLHQTPRRKRAENKRRGRLGRGTCIAKQVEKKKSGPRQAPAVKREQKGAQIEWPSFATRRKRNTQQNVETLGIGPGRRRQPAGLQRNPESPWEEGNENSKPGKKHEYPR